MIDDYPKGPPRAVGGAARRLGAAVAALPRISWQDGDPHRAVGIFEPTIFVTVGAPNSGPQDGVGAWRCSSGGVG